MAGQASVTSRQGARSAGVDNSMHADELRDWLTLQAIHGLGNSTRWTLVQAFGTPRALLSAPAEELRARGCSEALARAIAEGPDAATRTAIDREIDGIVRRRVTVLSCLDPAYPALLTTIADPPSLLYVSGDWRAEETCTVAIVGSRKATPQARVFTEQLSAELVAAGWTVVSGLARGIDAAAHRGALVGGGRTLAVLGCGIDRVYPPEHAALRKDVERQGAVLSEFPLGSPPHSYHFLRRNRIISGLSRGVIVVEATLKSGALVTARLAAEQGREVFAVPGPVRQETSRGPHRLIKEGAALVESAADVLTVLLPQLDADTRARLTPLAPAKAAAGPSDTPTADERLVLDALGAEPVHIDDLTIHCGLAGPTVMATLLGLELQGAVRSLPGQLYLRC